MSVGAGVAYFDYAATTPADPRVIEEMIPHFGAGGSFGNASSAQHRYGADAAEVVHLARRRVARSIGAGMNEIMWTSGATEANNLAIQGSLSESSKRVSRLVTVATEHHSVLQVAAAMKKRGIDVVTIPVRASGEIDLEKFEQQLDGNTLVSVMWVNNETGVIQPILEISRICEKCGAMLHVDAAQAVGKIAVNVKNIPLALMSMSAHKAYGPKGIGALFIRKGTTVSPLTFGGGQENGLRSGTLPVPLIAGMGKAFELSAKEWRKDAKNISVWHRQLCQIIKGISHSRINGMKANRVPHILNVSFEKVGREIIPAMRKVAVSSSSACTTEKVTASHVLIKMGLSKELATNSIRISFGRFTSEQEVSELGQELRRVIPKLQS